MNKTVINIKADKDVKEKAKKIAKELGIPLSTVINAYLKEFIRNREVRLSLEPRLRPEIEKLLLKANEDFKKRKNISPAFSSMEEAIKYLNE